MADTHYFDIHNHVITSLTSLFSLYPKGHRPMSKIHVVSFYIHYHWKRNYIHAYYLV